MPELRLNLITREWVIIATERAKRPDDFRQKRDKKYLPQAVLLPHHRVRRHSLGCGAAAEERRRNGAGTARAGDGVGSSGGLLHASLPESDGSAVASQAGAVGLHRGGAGSLRLGGEPRAARKRAGEDAAVRQQGRVPGDPEHAGGEFAGADGAGGEGDRGGGAPRPATAGCETPER